MEIGFDEPVQLTIHDGGDLADFVSRSMVFDHLVGLEDIGPDLAAPGDVLLFTDDGIELGFLLPLLHFKEARLQNFHGAVAILQLRPFVLTLHHDAGRNVGDTNGGLDFVHVLPAGAPGSKRIDPQVFVVDHHLHIVFEFGVDKHRREGRMPSFVGVERGDPHKAMHAGFGFEIAVGIGPADGQRGALNAGLIPREQIQRLYLKSLLFGPSHIHAQQHLRPVLRLGSAGSGMDREDGVARVQFA